MSPGFKQHEREPRAAAPDPCPHSEDIRAIRSDLHSLTIKLLGDDEKPGVFERLRDLEQTRTLMLWVIGAAATPIIGAIALGIWAIMTGKLS